MCFSSTWHLAARTIAPTADAWFHRLVSSVVDAAIHNDVPSTRALFPYLPAYWIEHVQNTMFKGPTEFYYPPTSPIAARPGSRPVGSAGDGPAGARPGAGQPTVVHAGSDLDLVRAQALQERTGIVTTPISPSQASSPTTSSAKSTPTMAAPFTGSNISLR